MKSRHWGVILAGGDGTRLKDLSRFLSGDDRPKQFCSLFGTGSLLARTRRRLVSSISPDRTLFVVVKDHERFYLPELAGVDPSRIVVQPSNRGTTAAIIYSLLRLTRLEKDPIVAFFPADHHFLDETQFVSALNGAFEVVRKSRELLVLLGARAERAEVEYGWIEPGTPLESGRGGAPDVFRVNRFWEKPSLGTAESLLDRGCLWNTFVIAGRARTFLDVLEAAIPHGLESFHAVANALHREQEMKCAAALYETLPAGDFSREVLARSVERLAVLRMENAGWGDLGTPEGVMTAIQKTVRSRSATNSANPAEDGSPTEYDPQPAASNAFNAWLAEYRQTLEEVCRRTPEKT